MLRVPDIRYVAPKTIGEAARILRDEPDAMLLAGGTDLVPNLKRRQQTPSVVVSLRRVSKLHRMQRKGRAFSIGACTTLSDIESSPAIRKHASAFWRAAAQIATPHLRNAGTVGGNLCLDTRCNYYNQTIEWRCAIDYCMKAPAPRGVALTTREGGVCWVAPGSPRCWAVSSSDGAPALIALGATVQLASVDGEREIALEELYANDGMAYLTKRRDEILTTVTIPASAPSVRSTYWKLRRRGSFDFPVLGVAAAVSTTSEGIVEHARVVLGAVASCPLWVPTDALIGKPLSDDVIEAFAHATSGPGKPLDNTDYELAWRKRMIHVFVRGALRELRGDDPRKLGLYPRRMMELLPE